MGAFLVSALLALPAAAVECRAPGELHYHRVQRVIDGDTLQLAGGQRLRLLNLNAPERGRDGRLDQPVAAEASRRLRKLIARAGNQVGLLPSPMLRDRHGRWLAAPFDQHGHSIEARLLAEGLAFQLVDARDSRMADCLQRAEHAARRQRLGLWQKSPLQSVYSLREPGFALLTGRVLHVSRRHASLWLELEGALQVQWPQDSARDERRLRALIGSQVEVRGWVTRRPSAAETRWRLRLLSPRMLQRH